MVGHFNALQVGNSTITPAQLVSCTVSLTKIVALPCTLCVLDRCGIANVSSLYKVALIYRVHGPAQTARRRHTSWAFRMRKWLTLALHQRHGVGAGFLSFSVHSQHLISLPTGSSFAFVDPNRYWSLISRLPAYCMCVCPSLLPETRIIFLMWKIVSRQATLVLIVALKPRCRI